ncbi:hypothetical protein [Aequorivita marina]|uniref:hypothetical protein n=1 Tax=Aequorivita marina TaxID=3073654 RepID=UPI002876AFA7|nr:hypothetical protein [Aequorivita sp. S2608]MDS1297183.1 hypothetical protein [Aequorivita sp. S2608]
MFKKVIQTKGFWKSVISLALSFALLFALIKWAIEGFDLAYFTERNPIIFLLTLLGAGFVYGFFVSFGKFRAKIKEKESR